LNRFRLAVLVSGSGTNLQAILDRLHGREGIEVVAVASNNPDCFALRRATAAGVETAVFAAAEHASRDERDRELADWLDGRKVDLVVLAGYMELLTPAFLRAFPNRVINVHPSLLPAFPGPRPVEDQLAYGAKVGGVTVHFVDGGVDTGPILLQEAVAIPYARGRDAVLKRLHETEHELLPRAIRLIARGAVRFDRDNQRLVHVDEGVLDEIVGQSVNSEESELVSGPHDG
jgi:phosphoribosylglycinamide formyltransferase 1